MGRPAWVFEIVGEVECEDVYGEHSGPPGAQRGEGFLVGVVPVSGKNNEGVHATLLPGAEQVIHPAVQSLAADGGVAGVWALGGGVDAVRDRGRAQHLEARGEIIGEPLHDERIAAQWQMWSVLFAGAYGHQEP